MNRKEHAQAKLLLTLGNELKRRSPVEAKKAYQRGLALTERAINDNSLANQADISLAVRIASNLAQIDKNQRGVFEWWQKAQEAVTLDQKTHQPLIERSDVTDYHKQAEQLLVFFRGSETSSRLAEKIKTNLGTVIGYLQIERDRPPLADLSDEPIHRDQAAWNAANFSIQRDDLPKIFSLMEQWVIEGRDIEAHVLSRVLLKSEPTKHLSLPEFALIRARTRFVDGVSPQDIRRSNLLQEDLVREILVSPVANGAEETEAHRILLDYYNSPPEELRAVLTNAGVTNPEKMVVRFYHQKKEWSRLVEELSFRLNTLRPGKQSADEIAVRKALIEHPDFLSAWSSNPNSNTKTLLKDRIEACESLPTGLAPAKLKLALAMIHFRDHYDIQIEVPLEGTGATIKKDANGNSYGLISETQIPSLVDHLELVDRMLILIPPTFVEFNQEVKKIILVREGRMEYCSLASSGNKNENSGSIFLSIPVDERAFDDSGKPILNETIFFYIQSLFHEFGHGIAGSYMDFPFAFSKSRLQNWELMRESPTPASLAPAYQALASVFEDRVNQYEQARTQVIREVSQYPINRILELSQVDPQAPPANFSPLTIDNTIRYELSDPYDLVRDLLDQNPNLKIGFAALPDPYKNLINLSNNLSEMVKKSIVGLALDPTGIPINFNYAYMRPKYDKGTDPSINKFRTNPDEFIAEMVKTFFLAPNKLKQMDPEIHGLLAILLGGGSHSIKDDIVNFGYKYEVEIREELNPAATIPAVIRLVRIVMVSLVKIFPKAGWAREWKKLPRQAKLDRIIRVYAPFVESFFIGVFYWGMTLLAQVALPLMGLDPGLISNVTILSVLNVVFGLLHTEVYRKNPVTGNWELHKATLGTRMSLAATGLAIHSPLLFSTLNPFLSPLALIGGNFTAGALSGLFHRMHNDLFVAKSGKSQVTQIVKAAAVYTLAEELRTNLLRGNSPLNLKLSELTKSRLSPLVGQLERRDLTEDRLIENLKTIGNEENTKPVIRHIMIQLKATSPSLMARIFEFAGARWAELGSGPMAIAMHDLNDWQGNANYVSFIRGAVGSVAKSNRKIVIAASPPQQDTARSLFQLPANTTFREQEINGQILDAGEFANAAETKTLLAANAKRIVNTSGLDLFYLELFSRAIANEIKWLVRVMEQA